MDRARSSRIPVNIKATYTLKGCQGEGWITDISTGGVAMEVKQIFVEGDLIRIQFKIDDKRDVDFWGIVKNITGSLLGIHYEEISHQCLDSINGYVSSNLSKMGKESREAY